MERHVISDPWFVKNPPALENIRTSLRAEYPNMHVLIENGRAVVRGTMPITWDGNELDRYSIELRLAKDHPGSAPLVNEIGGRIPRVIDRHTNPDGTLCLGVAEEVWAVGESGFDVLSFLNGPVRNFLIGNTLVENGQPWPHGDRAHGVDGICQFYGERVGISEPKAVLELLEYLSKPKVMGHWTCPCKSGKILRSCHRVSVMRAHSEISKKAVAYSLGQMRKHLRIV